MSLFDIFRISKFKARIELLMQENQSLHALLLPEHKDIIELKKVINSLQETKNNLAEVLGKLEIQIQTTDSEHKSKLHNYNSQYNRMKNELLILEDQLMLESFALYEPKYAFTNSDEYKQKLDQIRDAQKTMIRQATAATVNQNWTVNNSAAQGKKMVNDMIKLLLRSFNNECDAAITGAKFNNIESCEKRITSSYETINKLGKIMNVVISPAYLRLKMEELHLAYEYQLKKQQEKEEQKQIREQMREEAKLQKEIEEARRTVEKERKHYANALEKAKKALEAASDDIEREAIQEKINDLSAQLIEVDKQIKDIDYREANQRAGYVYVISNIGSFGENVYKIGMTRRLDPYDRIYELGDASVPFNFDVHAMIFSDDAPKLESALHKTFEKNKLNAINTRREFFNVTLDEIEQVVKQNHDKTVEFIRTAEAEEFRESLVINKTTTLPSGLLEAAASREQ